MAKKQPVTDIGRITDDEHPALKAAFLQDSQQRAVDPLEVYKAAHPEMAKSKWAIDMNGEMQHWYTDGSELTDLRDAG